MSNSFRVPLLDMELWPGRPPVLRVGPGGDSAEAWAGAHREALRAAVTEHGCVLVRGLGLGEAAETGAVFRQLTAGLMTEKEAFATRQAYPGGLYSSSKWPPNQQMCMHHELSYALEFPGLMLFACLQAPSSGGATAVADSTEVLSALPTGLIERFEREGWVLTRNYNEDFGASVRGGVRHRLTAPPSRPTAGPTRSNSSGSPTACYAPGSAAARWSVTR